MIVTIAVFLAGAAVGAAVSGWLVRRDYNRRLAEFGGM